MAQRFTISPGHCGLNLDQDEERIFISGLERARRWAGPIDKPTFAEFDRRFYWDGSGVSERMIRLVGTILRRHGIEFDDFPDSPVSIFMRSVRGNDRATWRRQIGEEVLGPAPPSVPAPVATGLQVIRHRSPTLAKAHAPGQDPTTAPNLPDWVLRPDPDSPWIIKHEDTLNRLLGITWSPTEPSLSTR